MGARNQDNLDKLDRDVHEGKVQDLIEQGWTIIQIAKRYGVSESKIRRLGSDGSIRFPKGKGGSLKDENVSPDKWSEAKRIAMGAW